ncbi:type 1 glutamine amidotransferase [Candidatus Cyanaurora vandensis]|uniref:type 1 glutamine amidotransferase n=1 Tax=Candidatus Cyanaurora vandensis TaxID=2714958 RepID=UPI00257E5F05|nr:type 1 glutamine amidotransferase [Candidatus Cyanaurora vandensis]
MSDLRILLVQIRQDSLTCEEELAEFVRYSELKLIQFTTLNVFEQALPLACVQGYDALFIGGSSDASVLQPEQYPFVQDLKALLLHCLDQSFPVLASCFGFQVVVEALGGRVILDEAGMELGTFPLRLTAAAQTDLLFHDFPQDAWVVCGHKERAAVFPAGCILLAATEQCPYQALRVADKPFYGFQFHPEMDDVDLSNRLKRYLNRYLKDPKPLENIIANIRETPEANGLIKKFVDRVILQEARSTH